MKKISFFLVVLMLAQCFLLAACNSNEHIQNETTPDLTTPIATTPNGTTPQETTPEVTTPEQIDPVGPYADAQIEATDISKYTLIYAQLNSQSVVDQLLQIQSQITNMYGDELSAQTDDYSVSDFEILIGDTNREESKSFLQGLLFEDYGYAIIGNKIVIAGNTMQGTVNAAKLFLEHLKDGDHSEVFFSNQNQYLYRHPYPHDSFTINGIDASRAKLVVNTEGADMQIAKSIVYKAMELCGRTPQIVTDAEVSSQDTLIIVGASLHVPAAMQAEWDAAKASGGWAYSYYIGSNNTVVWINTDTQEGYNALHYNVISSINATAGASLQLDTGLVQVPPTFSVMSFNVYVSSFNAARTQRVLDTILENAPSVFGVQEASVAWMNALNSGLGDMYATVGVGRDGVGVGEHSAIFYRKDQFTLIESGTKWLSYTPDVVASKLSQANYPRIMTYVVLERNCDGVQFLYVNTHLDHDGKNGIEGGEKVRQEQIEILIAEINKLGNYPTIVTGDFNVTQEASAYTTMIANGFIDASRVSKAGERKPTYNGMDDQYAGVTIDYIFVSGSLAYSVDTYKVCPAKRNDEWISDHNAIIATIMLPTPTTEK